jgi:hypothetical protein
MLKIRPEQVEVLRQYMVRQFEERMRIHLWQVFPHELKTVAEMELREHIRLGVEKAMSYQVTKEGDVQRYLECAVVYGWEFDTTPWARGILCRTDWDGEIKMDKVEQDGLTER